MTSPTTPADFRKGVPGRSPRSFITNRILRCTGFSPSRTSGIARLVVTESAYGMKESRISSSTAISMISFAIDSGSFGLAIVQGVLIVKNSSTTCESTRLMGQKSGNQKSN